jgi:hypothetical protein
MLGLRNSIDPHSSGFDTDEQLKTSTNDNRKSSAANPTAKGFVFWLLAKLPLKRATVILFWRWIILASRCGLCGQRSPSQQKA